MSLTRKIVKNKTSYWVSLPKDLVIGLQWKSGDFVNISPQSNNILIIERLLNGKKRLR